MFFTRKARNEIFLIILKIIFFHSLEFFWRWKIKMIFKSFPCLKKNGSKDEKYYVYWMRNTGKYLCILFHPKNGKVFFIYKTWATCNDCAVVVAAIFYCLILMCRFRMWIEYKKCFVVFFNSSIKNMLHKAYFLFWLFFYVWENYRNMAFYCWTNMSVRLISVGELIGDFRKWGFESKI